MFDWVNGRMELPLGQEESDETFNPDRARRTWREIPVATGGPSRDIQSIRLKLPDGGEGYAITGASEFAGGYPNLRITREVRMEGDEVNLEAETFMTLGEIAPGDLAQAKRDARRLENSGVEVQAPTNIAWRWDMDEDERKEKTAPIIAAYTQAIEFADENDFSPLQSRAMFLENIYEYDAALEDYTLLVEEDPSPWAHHRRAAVLEALGRKGEAIQDLQAAYDLDPQNGTAFGLARMLAYEGRTQEAEELLGFLAIGDDEELTMADTLATVSGLEGEIGDGLLLISDQVDINPGSAEALNSDCWYRGLFNAGLDGAIDLCTRAVERASFAAPPLDSRALVRYRLGMMDEALDDVDAALEMAPHLAASMYLRGVIRMTTGDDGGQEDIAAALRMAPQLEEFYSRHGVVVPPS